MKTVTVEYFAVLRDHSGRASEQISTEAVSPQQLFDELAARYGFPPLQTLKVAVNDEFSDMQAPLNDGDSVVFIPPVAGG